MSALAPNAPSSKLPSPSGASGLSGDVVTVRSYKAPIGFGIFTALALVLFVLLHGSGTTTFKLASPDDFVQLPAIPFHVVGTGIVVTVLLAIGTAFALYRATRARRVPTWATVVFAIVFVIGFLVWSVPAGSTIPIPGLLVGALGLSAPLIFGSLGGVISERVGVVNIAIEGQFLAGAFASAVLASITHSAWVGLIAAVIAGVLVSFILAAFSIKYLVDQVIVGVVINAFVSGLTGFLYSKVLATDTALNSGVRFPAIPIPGLANIPIIGPVFFDQSVIVYLMYIAVAAVTIGLFTTRWGLRLRAVGEHPQAADTVGINVAMTRFWNVSLAGAIAGLGGAYFTLGSVGPFAKDMTAGAGYIALAAVIFGRWDPIKATFAALLFGFASNLQNILGAINSPVPSQFLLMLPYVVTIFAVAGLVGQSRGPAASGKPYIKS
jgi:general nucleoside transport system permease protein